MPGPAGGGYGGIIGGHCETVGGEKHQNHCVCVCAYVHAASGVRTRTGINNDQKPEALFFTYIFILRVLHMNISKHVSSHDPFSELPFLVAPVTEQGFKILRLLLI